MKNRTSKMISDIGSLDARVFLWKVARYLFVFVFIFSIIAGLLVYFVVSFAMGFSPFSSWGEMNNFHIQFAVSLALGMVLFSVLLTLMLIEIYQKVIYYPIRELLNEFNIFLIRIVLFPATRRMSLRMNSEYSKFSLLRTTGQRR